MNGKLPMIISGLICVAAAGLAVYQSFTTKSVVAIGADAVIAAISGVFLIISMRKNRR